MRVASATYGLLLALLTATAPASAQYQPVRPDLSQRSAPSPDLNRIDVVEHLGETIPLDLGFRDLDGHPVRLRELFAAGKPVLLVFAYHTCNTVCSLILDAVQSGVHDVPWTAGQEYQIVSVSLDPNEDLARARAKRDQIVARYGREGAASGFHFLVGDEASIQRLTDSVGYKYFYDARQQQFAHPAVVMFLTPEGKVARYLHGVDYPSFDVRLALLEASQGRSMSTADHILQFCYAYDPTFSTYTAKAMRVMQLGGVVTLLFLGSLLFVYWRAEKRRAADSSSTQSKSTALEVGA